MLAILQFDAASLPHIQAMSDQGYLPTFASLRKRGTWYALETPARHFEGAAPYSVYTGTDIGEHGLYYPWMWSAAEQCVRFSDDFPAPEAVWERIGRADRRSLIIDPYEMRPPQRMQGVFIAGWQFKNRVVLRCKSVPHGMHRWLARELGRPPLGEEVYGRPDASELLRLRSSLVAAPRRAADVADALLKREGFDLVWLTLSAAHLGGHRFLDMSLLSEEAELAHHRELGTALQDIYRAVDEAMARIIEALPADTDIMVMSPSGMGPHTSRSHLLPGMLEAVLSSGNPGAHDRRTPSGSSIWRVRAAVPTGIRAWVARMLPDRWAVELAARPELRAVDWAHTRAFMLPNDDMGYVRLNLRGRERDGIVEPEEAEALLREIATGLQTFCDPDGKPAIRKVDRVLELGVDGGRFDQLPDLIYHAVRQGKWWANARYGRQHAGDPG